MELEQQSPNKPNFALIVTLFGVAILAFFVFALVFLHWDGKHLSFRHTHTQRITRSVDPYVLAPTLA